MTNSRPNQSSQTSAFHKRPSRLSFDSLNSKTKGTATTRFTSFDSSKALKERVPVGPCGYIQKSIIRLHARSRNSVQT